MQRFIRADSLADAREQKFTRLDGTDRVIHIGLTMKSASIRDLRNSFPAVARWIEEGECVEITRSGKPFARLEPIRPEIATPLVMPDFLSRMRNHFPTATTGKGLSSAVEYDRGDYDSGTDLLSSQRDRPFVIEAETWNGPFSQRPIMISKPSEVRV